MGARLRAFCAFLYDFVIGDDWLVAAGVVVGLALTYALSRTSVAAWWLIALVLVVLLPVSLWRATHGSRAATVTAGPPDPVDVPAQPGQPGAR
jgi:hypothetical protein